MEEKKREWRSEVWLQNSWSIVFEKEKLKKKILLEDKFATVLTQ